MYLCNMKYKQHFRTADEMVDEIFNGVMVINKNNDETYYYSEEHHKFTRNFVDECDAYMDFPPITQQLMSEDEFRTYINELVSTYNKDSRGFIENMQVIYLDV